MVNSFLNPSAQFIGGARRCSIEVVSNGLEDGAFLAAWHGMVAASGSPEAVFQTPRYFELMLRTPGEHRGELLAVRDTQDGRLLSIVPVRVWRLPVKFNMGLRLQTQLRVPVVSLLGSALLGDPPPDVAEQVLEFLLTRHRHCAGISMQALPQESALWNSINASAPLRRLCRFWPMYGWRSCHTVPLQGSFEQYLEPMSPKKRYNLARQVRLLEKEAGELRLHVVREAAQVPVLVQALQALATDDPAVSRPEHWLELAGHKLLRAFVLTAGDRPVGAILGMQAQRTLHLHRILFDAGLARLSVGTSLTYLTVKALCELGDCSLIDMGYGTPAHVQQSTNVTQPRAHMVMLRRTWSNHVLAESHDALEKLAVRVKTHLAARRAQAKARLAANASAPAGAPTPALARQALPPKAKSGAQDATAQVSGPPRSARPQASATPPGPSAPCPGPAQSALPIAAANSRTGPKSRPRAVAGA
ncbi:GNAT family N-acetyltransferase [Azohydromonas aeria]|uniref:GNAT family N-acetyltransferase n=1 Tax=Azohydromonas aeria TaxID=2590212 RepID=UPI0012F95541|nr:GNAT family N-acetyltransferase [Azohydromonas aeria]